MPYYASVRTYIWLEQKPLGSLILLLSPYSIYQFNEYREYYPTTDEVLHVIDRIMISSEVLDKYLEKKGAIKYDIEK